MPGHIKVGLDNTIIVLLEVNVVKSCPCCRAEIYLSNIDCDAWFGACQICIKNNSKKNILQI